MTVTYGNLIEGQGKRVVMFVLPVLVLPLALAGVTAKPILNLRDTSLTAQEAQARADDAKSLRQELDSMGPLNGAMGRALALEQALQEMVPGSLKTLEVYSAIRRTAQVSGYALISLQVDDPVLFQGPLDGRVIGSRSVRLKGTGNSAQVSAFVDQLRAAGLPTAVKGFALVRRSSGAPFDIDLEVDVFHRIPPAVQQVEDSLASEGETAPK